MSTDQAWTVGRLLAWTTDYLQQHGSETPRLDAEVLLAEARGCERIMLYTAFAEEVPEDARAKFRESVKRRASGMPVAYIVGRKEFYSLSFKVTPDVLVPRPETEHAVIAVLDLLKQRAAGEQRVIDIGTGSGCIAVSIAKHAPAAKLTAVDVSGAALAVARENAQEHGVADRITLVESDLFAKVPAGVFDVVVSNPPYVSEAEIPELHPSARDFEPRGALIGGATGLEVTSRLVEQAAQRLESGGWIVLEISARLERETRELLAAAGRFDQITTIKDLAQLPRVVQARRT